MAGLTPVFEPGLESVELTRVAEGPKAGAYAYYVVVLLATAYMLSFMDRTLVSLLIAPIKAEFHLSDIQVGMMIGFGFVIFYSVLGLPFGEMADRSDRRKLILAGLLAWSLATTGSGLTVSFAALIGMRALVGVGEATLSPCAYSTLADRFPREKLGFAVSIYAAGVSVGGGLAMVFGGALVQWASQNRLALPLGMVLQGWRLALFAVGLLGAPLFVLMALTLREAPRHIQSKAPPIREVWRYIARRPRAMVGVLTAFALSNVANYVIFLWAPALFMRMHYLSAQTTGLIMGSIVGLFGTAGMVIGGAAADRLAGRGARDGAHKVVFWAVVAQIPLAPAAFLASGTGLAFVLMAPFMMLATAASSVQAVALQLMTPPRMRGRMISIYLLAVTLVGMGIGPLAIGILSDRVFSTASGLAPAMAIVATTGLVAAAIVQFTTRRSAAAVVDEIAG